MELHKYICDICKKEIDVQKDKAMGVFEYYFLQELLTIDDILTKKVDIQEKPVKKVKYDLCRNCLEKIELFIKEKLEKTK